MAFAYTTGTATSIANWFATFEAWITGTVGWAVESGSGTEDLVISSDGEASGLTKLFARIWQNPSPSYQIRGEVRDDAVGTNKTTSLGYVETTQVGSFTYWITADKNAIVICVKAEQYNMIYLGLVEPFALSPPDETYYTIAMGTSHMYTPTVLRGPTGSWDYNTSGIDNYQIDGAGRDDYDGSFPLGRIVVGYGDDIVGLLYHVGCGAFVTSVNFEDTCTSISPGGSSTWIILGDRSNRRIPVQTGGTLPTGTGDGANYAYNTGTAVSIGHFFTRLNELMAQVGWGIFDNRFFSGYPGDWIYSSNGESGTDNIYIRIFWDSGSNYLTVRAQDGPSGNPAHYIEEEQGMYSSGLPATYHILADRDCVLVTLENPSNVFRPIWCGLVKEFNPNLPSGSEYRTAIIAARPTFSVANMETYVLRGHDGAWEQLASDQLYLGEDVSHNDDNPLDVDGSTYIIWPDVVYDVNQYNQIVAYGLAKYLFHIDDNNIALDDTVTVGGTPYLILYSYNISGTYDTFYGIRSDAGIFSSSSSSSFSSSSFSSSSSSFSSSSFSSSSSSFSSSSFSSSSFSSSSFSSSSFSSSSSSTST